MDFDEDNNVAEHGKVLEGAIFMSNRATKKECLRRKLFGLPPSQAPFVKKVKAGMVLFLFEYEERKLNGVFEASSDGALNIVPHAFSSSGKPFSAQILFNRVWLCHPLSEDEFYDAIKGNYYTSNKFHFGLSKEQVWKLIWLFEKKKINHKISQSLVSGNNTKNYSEKPSVGRINVIVERRSVTTDTDSSEDDCTVDNERELVRLNRYSDLPKPNLSLSNDYYNQADDSELENQHGFQMTAPQYYNKQVLNADVSTHEHERGSSLTFPCITPLTSQQNATTVGNVLRPHSYILPDFKSQSTCYADSSFCLKSDPIQELRTSSSCLQGSPFPFSSSLQYPYHIDAERLDTRYHNTRISSDLRDDDVFPSESRVQGHEPYIPYSRDHIFRSKNIDMNLSSSSEDDDSYFLPEIRAQHYEPSSSILPYLDANKFTKNIGSSYLECNQGKCLMHMHGYSKPATLQHGHVYKGQGFLQPKRFVEWDSLSSECNLHFDKHEKRVSVFSRLSVPETSVQDDENEMQITVNDEIEISVNDELDISASELLGILATRRKKRMMLKKARRKLIKQDDDKDHESEAPMEMTLGDENNLWGGSDTVEGSGELPFLNFGRRSKVQRTSSEMGVNVNAKEGEDSLGKLKRRKLIRPSFGNEKSIDGGNSNDIKTKLLSQEHTLSISNAEGDGNAKGCSQETNVDQAGLTVSGGEEEKKVNGLSQAGFEQAGFLAGNGEDDVSKVVDTVQGVVSVVIAEHEDSNNNDRKTRLLSQEHDRSISNAEGGGNAKGCSQEANVDQTVLSVSGGEEKK